MMDLNSQKKNDDALEPQPVAVVIRRVIFTTEIEHTIEKLNLKNEGILNHIYKE